jgi:hypothetical protein
VATSLFWFIYNFFFPSSKREREKRGEEEEEKQNGKVYRYNFP